MPNEIINNLPQKIIIGAGGAEKIAAELGGHKTLIVTDRGVLATGLTDNLTRHIKLFDLFSDISAEPTTNDLDKLLKLVNEGDYEAIIGVGGGSALDMAKAAAALSGSILSAAQALAQACPGNATKRGGTEPPFLAAIPTTAGTGSESTLNAIFIDSSDGVKKAIISTRCLPKAAVLDPLLSLSLPAALTASTGTDALCHCVEALTSIKANPISETYSRRGIQLIEQNLPLAVTSPRNIQARENMLTASFWGGAALAIAGTNAIHALAYPLGKRGVPHGTANSMLFMPVMRFNFDACGEKLMSLAACEKNPAQVLERFGNMLAALPIPRDLSGFSIPESDLGDLAGEAMEQTRLLGNNPKSLTEEDAKKIYAQLF